MQFYLHGENSITYNFFTDLSNKADLCNFLDNIRWLRSNPRIKLIDAKSIQIHLFPSFGRGQYGMGEPDAIIITNSFIFFIEVETENFACLPRNYYKQMERFIQLGDFFSNSNRVKIVGNPLSIINNCNDNKKIKGRYRTRKLIKEILALESTSFYYITIADGHITKKIDGKSIMQVFNEKLEKKNLTGNHGLIGLYSVCRLNFVTEKTIETIDFNRKKI